MSVPDSCSIMDVRMFLPPSIGDDWHPAGGHVITASEHPDLVKELQKHPERTVSEEQWQELCRKWWLEFEMPGGVQFFVLDISADTIRLPDLRNTLLDENGVALHCPAGLICIKIR